MSTSRRRRPSPAGGRGLKIALWSAGSLIVLVLAVILGGRVWVSGYLKSEEFRQFVSRKTGETLQADSDFAPLHVGGMSFFSDRFHARGSKRAMFSDLQIDQIRADVSTRRFLEGVWQVDQVTAQQLNVK